MCAPEAVLRRTAKDVGLYKMLQSVCFCVEKVLVLRRWAGYNEIVAKIYVFLTDYDCFTVGVQK